MFGQMERDGGELMEWENECKEAAQLGLIMTLLPPPSCSSCLFTPSIKALTQTQRLSV